MVTINTTLRVVECTDCGEMLELRGRSPEAHIIAAEGWERKHRCDRPVQTTPKPQTNSQGDRWRELFRNALTT